MAPRNPTNEREVDAILLEAFRIEVDESSHPGLALLELKAGSLTWSFLMTSERLELLQKECERVARKIQLYG